MIHKNLCQTGIKQNSETTEQPDAKDYKDQDTNSAIKSELVPMCLSKGHVSVGASLNQQQKESLNQLLEAGIELFAFDPSQLGMTTLCQSQIDTGNNRPFSLPPYGCPLSERLLIKEEIGTQIKFSAPVLVHLGIISK